MAAWMNSSPSASREALAARNLLRRWTPHPELFADEALGVDLWSAQVQILQALAKPGARVAVRSGHKTGKTKLASVALHWWAQCKPEGRGIFTGPTWQNIQNVLWPEVRTVYQRAKVPLGGKLYDDLGKGVKLAGSREIFGLTVKDPESFAGLSGRNLLFVVDEASGVSESVFEAIFGNTAGGASVLLIGNPTRVSGTFFDAFHSKRTAWQTFHIDSRTTPNFDPSRAKVPGLATPEWVKWMIEQYGEGSPQFAVRVEGDFPRQGSDSVIALGLVEDARLRWEVARVEERKPSGTLSLGVDVARFGDDDSVIAVKRGESIVELVVVHGYDSIQVAGKVLEVAKRHRDITEPPPKVKVDTCGGYGAGVMDQLTQYPKQVQAIGVNAADSPTSQPSHGNGYALMRDQLWFGLREWLEGEGAFPEDPKLEAELVCPVFSYTPSGKMKVEPKDDTKKKLKRSPDRADAVALAVYDPPVIILSARTDGRGRRALAGGTGGF